jgi:EAL domain-containing protein (putative c-di-GMP-specific phosphodiesterase class I)/GGDEF domain-containing protein
LLKAAANILATAARKKTRAGPPSSSLSSFTFAIALPAIAVYLGVCALIFLAMHLMSSEMNAIDSDRGRKAIAAAVESLVVSLADTAADEATGTEAYINIYVLPNPAWYDSVWGATARISETYDTAIITDVEGTVIFGETSRGPVSGALGDIFSAVPELTRELEAGIARIGDNATVSHLARSEEGIVALAGAVVRGSTGQAGIPREQRRLLWLARRLDDSLLTTVASRFHLPKPRLVAQPSPGHDWMELADASGTPVATVDWMPRRPGDPAFASAATLAAPLMLLIGILVFAVLAAFRRTIKLRAIADSRDWTNARFDQFTGRLNRFGFEEHLIDRTPRKNGIPAAFCQLFVEDSIAVVGLYGRDVVNQLMHALAERFHSLAGNEVILARTGPAEFTLVWLGDGSAEPSRTFAETILTGLGDPISVGDLKLKIALSIGLLEAELRRDNVSSILRRLETAVSVARETGGSQAIAYDPRMEEDRRHRIELQADIRRGLDAGEFDLEYQPIIDFRTRSIVGVEALMRWRRRAAGPMGPGEFIPVAEASGLIDDLGMFALRRAIEEIGPLRELKISVNVSTAQLKNPSLPQTVFATLEEWGVDPARLQLEVTESFLVSHPDRAIKLIEQLRQGGILIALDDFGTGYSSIGYLKQFSFDRVKLDRSLVDHIDQDPVQTALVESTMVYAYAMGLAVTAEGIERHEEAAILSRLGCREFQGFLFARPLRIEQLKRLLGEEETVLKQAS